VRKGESNYPISIYSIKSKVENILYTADDFVREIWVDPTGKKAALGIGGLRTDTVEWIYLDLEKKMYKKLDELKGFTRARGLPGAANIFLTTEGSPDSTNTRYATLDLTSGKPSIQLELELAQFSELVRFSEDGRIGLVWVQTNDGKSQVWLIDSNKTGAALLAEDGVSGLSLSPDGSAAVFGVVSGKGDNRQGAIKLYSTRNGSQKEIGTGYSPVWVYP
jgi:Tol biopolymer transport system component